MTVQEPLFKRISGFKHLPTLPHVLLKLIEACNQTSPDLQKIAQIIGKDPALSGKILQLVNSAHFGLNQKVESMAQAVVFLGTSGVKNIVFCACVYDAFPKPKQSFVFSLKKFWWHSLRCAFLARHMAAAWGLCNPDEAFLAGLLHDIGRAVLWVNFKKPYEEILEACGDDAAQLLPLESRMGATHAEVGGWLLKRWRLDPLLVSSVRYHHHAQEEIAQALAIVQVVYAANLLCLDGENQILSGMNAVSDLFHKSAEEGRTLMACADQEARETAVALDIEVEAMETDAQNPIDQVVQARLAHEVRQISLTLGTLEGFLTAKDQGAIMRCIADGLKILGGVKRAIFFLFDEKKNALIGYLTDKSEGYVRQPMLAVSMRMTGSLLIRTLVEKHPMNSLDLPPEQSLVIVDEQIIQLLGGSGVYCIPLLAQDDRVGVLAVGLDADNAAHFTENIQLLNLLAQKGALALRLNQLRRQMLTMVHTSRMDATSDLARRVVHEVNNPLGVIKNYLKVIGMKMADAGLAQDEIRIINEEISRVGRLLKKLTSFSKTDAPVTASVHINALLTDMLKLTREALAADGKIHVETHLEPDVPVVTGDSDALKQIFMNLLKNAAEAMADTGGRIDIHTRHLARPLVHQTSRLGEVTRGHVEIVFSDTGPGIPEAIREKPFDPYVSTKSGDHAGLGLAVVHHLITAMHGTIRCDSDPGHGTTFTIELPVTPST